MWLTRRQGFFWSLIIFCWLPRPPFEPLTLLYLGECVRVCSVYTQVFAGPRVLKSSLGLLISKFLTKTNEGARRECLLELRTHRHSREKQTKSLFLSLFLPHVFDSDYWLVQLMVIKYVINALFFRLGLKPCDLYIFVLHKVETSK